MLRDIEMLELWNSGGRGKKLKFNGIVGLISGGNFQKLGFVGQ